VFLYLSYCYVVVYRCFQTVDYSVISKCDFDIVYRLLHDIDIVDCVTGLLHLCCVGNVGKVKLVASKLYFSLSTSTSKT